MKTVRKWNIKLQFKQQDFLFTTFYIYKKHRQTPTNPLSLAENNDKKDKEKKQSIVYLFI